MLIHADFFSRSLWRNTELYIALPSPNSGEHIGKSEDAPKPSYYVPGFKWPTLILFHCNFGGANEWVRFSAIERYAQRYRVAVVMPDCENSGGMDMVHGPAFHRYLHDELFQILRSTFPVSLKREELYVGGPSFGGYGAAYLVLHDPEAFGGLIMMSSMLDFPSLCHNGENATVRRENPQENIFADPMHLQGTQFDLLKTSADDVAAGLTMPRFYIACGAQDVFAPHTHRTAEHLRGLGLSVTEHNTDGRHTWSYWDGEIDRAMAWMTGRKPKHV